VLEQLLCCQIARLPPIENRVGDTADKFNGADLGIREEWVPLFDKYGVDLVVCGHEHHYERSHPIRGREENATLTPVPAATATDVIDTTKGTVHMVIGGGGTSAPSNTLFFNPNADIKQTAWLKSVTRDTIAQQSHSVERHARKDSTFWPRRRWR
jgi:hypothetical protein